MAKHTNNLEIKLSDIPVWDLINGVLLERQDAEVYLKKLMGFGESVYVYVPKKLDSVVRCEGVIYGVTSDDKVYELEPGNGFILSKLPYRELISRIRKSN